MQPIQSTFVTDTIAAIATPPGQGGIGIIRLSGPQAPHIVTAIIKKLPQPRIAAYRKFLDAEQQVLDEGIVLYFPAPHSFTGEDVVELQGHGGPAVLNAVLRQLINLGARLAKPGEFSERAFLNNRLDLVQAEAIADLIEAGSEQAARAAARSLQGEFSKAINQLNQELIQFRSFIEASIDFAEEEIDFLNPLAIEEQLKQIIKHLHILQKTAQQGRRLQEGMYLVIAGPPNAGKSSLLNALSGQEIAIVTPISGTTRDVLQTTIFLDGLPIHIIDTAGLHDTQDIIEKEGIRRALLEIEKADQILWVTDSTLPLPSREDLNALMEENVIPMQTPLALIRNKIDLSHETSRIQSEAGQDIIYLSAQTGEGLEDLRTYLKNRVGYNNTAVGFSARERHIASLTQVEKLLSQSLHEWQSTAAVEILAANLMAAHRMLGEITGVFTTEDLLGSIFSQFCIGK
jgi:tRNA modification GTPase